MKNENSQLSTYFKRHMTISKADESLAYSDLNLRQLKNDVFWNVASCRYCVNRRFGGKSVHTRSTWRHIPEDGILHSHRRENLKSYMETVSSNLHYYKFDFIHFWSVTLVNTIKTTSFIPPSVIKLHLLFAHAFTCFGFLVNHLQKAHQLFKGNYHYTIHSYIKLVYEDLHYYVQKQVQLLTLLSKNKCIVFYSF
jgi:hypothetical protein